VILLPLNLNCLFIYVSTTAILHNHQEEKREGTDREQENLSSAVMFAFYKI